MADLGKAYVQIIPKATGIEGQLKQMVGGGASAAGSSAGASIGESLVGKLKGVIAAAGLGAAIKTALDAGGALQQSFGGLNTIYGEAAAQAKEFASQAASAGISANSYAEQAVSFGASLKQAFGGDVTKAAKAANTAILDMADNSAKMGTSMDAIQSAYQGFAKNNYTMLDNLKLGYGGTKTEMERLLSDAEKLTGVHYDISNLGDVYSAIHAIQTDLKISGVAAEEAKTTFTGSFGAMKAAAENLVASLTLGQDIQPAMQQLATSVSNFLFNNLFPMIGNILSGLPTLIGTFLTTAMPQILQSGVSLVQNLMTGIQTGLPLIMTGIQTMMTNIVTWIRNDFPTIMQNGVEMISNFATGLLNSLPSVVSNISTILQELLSAIANALPTILDSGMQLIANLADGILRNMPVVITNIGSILQKLIGTIMDNLPEILQKGIEIVGKLAEGILNNLPAIISAITEVIGRLLSTIAEHLPELLQKGIELIGQMAAGLIQAIPDILANMGQVLAGIADAVGQVDWLSLGWDIIRGIAQGIANAAGLIWDALKSAIKSAWDGALSWLGIGSPSKVMAKSIGQWIPKGIAVGIDDNAGSVSDSMQAITDEVIGTSMQPNITASAARMGSYVASGVTGSGTTNNMGGVSITINAQDGQSAREIAEEVEDILTHKVTRKKEAFK